MSRLSGTIEGCLYAFSGGNPGALTTLFELMKERTGAEFYFMIDLETLDDIELYEDKIYMLWNDSCDRDIKKFIKILDLYRNGKITLKDIEERVKNVGYGKSFDDLLLIEKEENE